MSPTRNATSASLLLATVASVSAAVYDAKDRQPTPAELAQLPAVVSENAAALLKEIRVPDGFNVSIFATPPAVNYPVFVSAAPDGTLYVSSDGNGSLDRKPHLGRVLRVRDTNGDGQADEVRAFVPDVDSPRGLVWDHDRLYLLHPPDISVYIDTNGDGVMDEEKTLIKGIAFTFKDRPADHSSNGLELGVDGWLYAAIGDFGFLEATGTDGRKLQLRGGGVVRFRPDGAGLQLFATGTRNILEIAVSPLLDGFARDNTNDGGGWDTRLHHFSGFTQHGYPRLFKNFPDEIIQPLADYGGGSGCGAAWIDEPGIPSTWNNAPFTCDWGREVIYHHNLTPKGATFSATQEEFFRLPRATDLDVDANSAIYAASWKGASFTWVGPDVGFIARITPKNFRAELLPDFERLTGMELVKLLESPSHRRRLESQRTLLRRGLLGTRVPSKVAVGESPQTPADALLQKATAIDQPVATRVAALFALKQHFGADMNPMLAELAMDPSIAAWAIRAFSDPPSRWDPSFAAPLNAGQTSPNPRIRKEAAIALGRYRTLVPSPGFAELIRDPDPVVVHSAEQSLRTLQAVKFCMSVLSQREATPAQCASVLRVLQSLPQPEVIDGLIQRLNGETRPERRAGYLTALCRLYFVEGLWKGDSWGTRPDIRGPLYQPEAWSETLRIEGVLKAAFDKASTKEAAWIGRELARHRIPAGDALDKLIARAADDPTLLPTIAAQLAESEAVPVNAIPLLAQTASADSTTDAIRAQAVIALAKTDSAEAWRAVLIALPRVKRTTSENNLSEKAQRAVATAPKLDLIHAVLEDSAGRVDGESSLIAEGLLLKLASRQVGAPEARAAANQSLDTGWTLPRRRVQILKAAAQVGDSSRATQFVAALNDGDLEVAKAAQEAVRRLKIDPEKLRAEASAQRVGMLGIESTLELILAPGGGISRGEQLFSQIGCNACHTTKADEPLKGPFLGTIANVYRRRELAEAILIPNKTIAQGFAANHFELKDGTEVDGFVVREAADIVTIRTITAIEQALSVEQIVKREKQEKSLMPEGLAAGLTVKELASLLDYIQSLAGSTPAKP
ncbi:MAG: heme-binding domain-containing protein [Pedosphaera sp.]|nr:heme-binding domain-containing protein [Pedosphaera sp.]